jgi:hypothetical protein
LTEANASAGATVRKRLSTSVRTHQLFPWRRAPDLKFHLYWAPVSRFPAPPDERTWMLRFFDAFNEAVAAQFELRPEVIVSFQVIAHNRDGFIRQAREFHPRPGLTRYPGETAVMPDREQLLNGAHTPGKDRASLIPGSCLWLSSKAEQAERELFQTSGGLTLLFRKDPGPPKALPFEIPQILLDKYPKLKQIDMSRLYNEAYNPDGLWPQLKSAFGGGLEDLSEFKATPFIVPRMDAAAFFKMGAEEIEKFFSIIDIYVQESVEDRGILLASRADFEKPIARTVTKLRQDGLIYPDEEAQNDG